MARVLLLLFTVLCSVLFAETALDIQKKKVVLKTLGQCRGQQSLPMTWYGFQQKKDDSTGEISASIKFKTKIEVSTDLSIVFNFWKCDASGNPDSCEQFVKDLDVADICTYMEGEDDPWTPFMKSFTTKLECPIKPGVYEAKSIDVNPKFLNSIPLEDAVWRVQMEGHDKGSKITCVYMEIQIAPLYVKRKS